MEISSRRSHGDILFAPCFNWSSSCADVHEWLDQKRRKSSTYEMEKKKQDENEQRRREKNLRDRIIWPEMKMSATDGYTHTHYIRPDIEESVPRPLPKHQNRSIGIKVLDVKREREKRNRIREARYTQKNGRKQ